MDRVEPLGGVTRRNLGSRLEKTMSCLYLHDGDEMHKFVPSYRTRHFGETLQRGRMGIALDIPSVVKIRRD